ELAFGDLAVAVCVQLGHQIIGAHRHARLRQRNLVERGPQLRFVEVTLAGRVDLREQLLRELRRIGALRGLRTLRVLQHRTAVYASYAHEYSCRDEIMCASPAHASIPSDPGAGKAPKSMACGVKPGKGLLTAATATAEG